MPETVGTLNGDWPIAQASCLLMSSSQCPTTYTATSCRWRACWCTCSSARCRCLPHPHQHSPITVPTPQVARLLVHMLLWHAVAASLTRTISTWPTTQMAMLVLPLSPASPLPASRYTGGELSGTHVFGHAVAASLICTTNCKSQEAFLLVHTFLKAPPPPPAAPPPTSRYAGGVLAGAHVLRNAVAAPLEPVVVWLQHLVRRPGRAPQGLPALPHPLLRPDVRRPPGWPVRF